MTLVSADCPNTCIMFIIFVILTNYIMWSCHVSVTNWVNDVPKIHFNILLFPFVPRRHSFPWCFHTIFCYFVFHFQHAFLANFYIDLSVRTILCHPVCSEMPLWEIFSAPAHFSLLWSNIFLKHAVFKQARSSILKHSRLRQCRRISKCQSVQLFRWSKCAYIYWVTSFSCRLGLQISEVLKDLKRNDQK
jgi:hypothetical protein